MVHNDSRLFKFAPLHHILDHRIFITICMEWFATRVFGEWVVVSGAIVCFVCVVGMPIWLHVRGSLAPLELGFTVLLRLSSER